MQMRVNQVEGYLPRKLYRDNEAPQFRERELGAIKEAELRIDLCLHFVILPLKTESKCE